MRFATSAAALAVTLACASQLSAQGRGCRSAEYRQFDFWIGEWEVVNQLNQDPNPPRATNKITSEIEGCVIREEYRTSTGYSGTSISFYDRTTGKWHQTWMDNGGAAVIQTGGMVGNDMVLTAQQPNGVLNRVTWSPLESGAVRQLWEQSEDGGKTWKPVFDGLYTRKENTR